MSETILSAKFKSYDRYYKDWDLFNINTLEKLDKTKYRINPIESRLLNHDIITINENGELNEVIYSTYTEKYTICGILIFDKMYGSIGKKYYFKFIPDDIRLPEFIVPYKLSKVGFYKKEKSKYTIIHFDRWTLNDIHPVGKIINIIGDVDKLENLYEYQLYCKSLHSSIREITTKANKVLKENTEDILIHKVLENYTIQDRTLWNIITIDPNTTKDYDDAFSYKKIENNTEMLSIYISNVVLWMDVMNLWGSFSERISTIYLPDRKRPMLPSILSDALFSLKEGKKRFAFTIDILVKDTKIIDYTFSNSLIKVSKNYTYEEDKTCLLGEKTYTKTFNLISSLNRNKDTKFCDDIKDSHDIITYLMILMNYYSAKTLETYQDGIYRVLKTLVIDEERIKKIENLPSSIKNFVWGWNSHGGKYMLYNKEFINHDILNLDVYIHITSPIRRLVDMLNIIKIQHLLDLYKMSHEMNVFYTKWTTREKMEYINNCMRSIRHIQNDCHILHLCFHNEKILQNKHIGYIIEKIKRNDEMFHYIVYIPSLKFITSYVNTTEYNIFQQLNFKLYLFKDEFNIKRKILIDIH